MKKIILLFAVIIPVGLAAFAVAPASAASMSVVSDGSVQVVGVYNEANGTSTHIDLSGNPQNAVLAAKPDPYPSTYVVSTTNSVWDSGTGDYFVSTNPGANWIWETVHAEDPATVYPTSSPLYDANASTDGRVVVFQKTFDIAGAPQTSTLSIAADNGWEAWINGTNIGRSSTTAPGWETSNLHQSWLNTTGWQAVGHITVPAGVLHSGINTITIDAGNEYFAADDGNNPSPPYSSNPYYQYNPGALIFKLDVSYASSSPLLVTKTANTSFTRTYDWTINKLADTSNLTLAPGETYSVGYSVVVDATAADSGWMATGTIAIDNPNAIAATITGVTDEMTGGVNAAVDCGVSFPYTLSASSTLTCAYSASLPDGTTRTNTATVATTGLVPGAAGTAPVVFTDPTTIVDNSVDVTDTLGGTLGTVSASGTPHTFNYSYVIGPYQDPGAYTKDNTAKFTTNDTHTAGDSSWTVNVNVPASGCTLTQGYWKTHSSYGPAPSDPAWNLWPGGPNGIFYFSGTSTINVLNMAPKGGNAYYTLAHQYIAAKLNVLNGASATAAVQAAMTDAESLFGNPTNTPTYVGGLKGSSALRKEFLNDASVLADYNEGLVGPGHCSEQAWQLVDTVNVNSGSVVGASSSVALEAGKTYLIIASGTWTNQFGAPTAFGVDATYISTSANWSTFADGPALGPNQLNLQVGDSFVGWGSYNPLHVYRYLAVGTGSRLHFRIFDGDPDTNTPNPSWYGDNRGSLVVTIYEQL